ncbi:MAG: ribonuclease HII [Subdoligranulum variabile]|nr:MAG: ribonuclease HII [Subdoligranulum variabile]
MNCCKPSAPSAGCWSPAGKWTLNAQLKCWWGNSAPASGAGFRWSARRSGRACRKSRQKKRKPNMKSNEAALYQFDAQMREKFGVLCGVDEAGRGPLCGPVCCAAVILDPSDPIEGVNDSKKLTEKRREALYEEITHRALAYKIVFVSPQEIDEKNILWATMGGMAQAVAGLDPQPGYALIDGNRCPPELAVPAQAVVKGDATSASIAAASILAKVSRDRYMLELDRQYPQYQLAKHKGYPTRLHYELIAQYGIQPFYRRSFLKKQGYWHEK